MKYHLWVLIILFAVIFQLQAGFMMLGLIIGWLHSRKTFDFVFNFDHNKIIWLESKCLCAKLKGLPGYVNIEMVQESSFDTDERMSPADIVSHSENKMKSEVHSHQLNLDENNAKKETDGEDNMQDIVQYNVVSFHIMLR